MSHERYPTMKIEIADRTGGEPRVFELNYSKITTQTAFHLARSTEYVLTALFQWRGLLHKLTEKANENDAYAIQREARAAQAIDNATKD